MSSCRFFRSVRILAVVGSVLVQSALTAQRREPDDPTPLTETERIQHVLSRFGFGATKERIDEVRAEGIQAWFEEQLDGAAKETYELGERLRELSTLKLSAADLFASYDPKNPGPTAPAKERRDYVRLRETPRRELLASIVLRGAQSNNVVHETLADFWRNHFNVDIGKSNLRLWAVTYERDVLRGHMCGTFGDLLEATAKHPAMLIYLDNALSRRPPTKGELSAVRESARARSKSKERAAEAVEIAKQRGLNENYARELLELHTLGVDNGYTQKDVIEVAKALTGWTVNQNPKRGEVGFCYESDMHARGDKYFLGRMIRPDKKNPLLEGEIILRWLERHSGTAEFIATKLCRHFVADDPPEKMVEHVAATFKRTGGNLREVYKAILDDPEFFDPKHYQTKFKRPFEFLLSAIRVTHAQIDDPNAVLEAMNLLQEPLYAQEDPTGYYDTAEAWNDPGVMAVRWQFAFRLAKGEIRGLRIPDEFYKGLHPRIPRVWKDQLARRILPAGLGSRSSETLDLMMRRYLADHPDPKREELAPRIVGLLLGSPEFQRQ
ncbi:MAG: DUF1800 domain-containing protein [Planctomycetes bacterium]|nr:DUF1800 domain-containing protein [Planctomycetota bacterium]MCB9890332.1 DUF1800 domain-containing protein [Planctomycetota bacterium]MCB9918150.1 DUF1800 domain-containing protein [Planctomycetota bacterium]